MANAHAWRHRNGRGKPCPTNCAYCTGTHHFNRNGNRHNPASKRRGKRGKK